MENWKKSTAHNHFAWDTKIWQFNNFTAGQKFVGVQLSTTVSEVTTPHQYPPNYFVIIITSIKYANEE